MLLPFRRDALRERARLDEADEADAYEHTTPSERIERSLELSELRGSWPVRSAAHGRSKRARASKRRLGSMWHRFARWGGGLQIGSRAEPATATATPTVGNRKQIDDRKQLATGSVDRWRWTTHGQRPRLSGRRPAGRSWSTSASRSTIGSAAHPDSRTPPAPWAWPWPIGPCPDSGSTHHVLAIRPRAISLSPAQRDGNQPRCAPPRVARRARTAGCIALLGGTATGAASTSSRDAAVSTRPNQTSSSSAAAFSTRATAAAGRRPKRWRSWRSSAARLPRTSPS